ncbi:uncharacterized protein LOC117131700 [Brassica rapa]|uniref:uncharacterized protein LOC117131700 n=1 Tax=Brassica campestris TaxID=3711 RepID=UPI00142DCC2D|nr:uncharacterized protein LOC117131700 [Brassica rapa]
MAVKTDMSKAYDRIEWNFLERVLGKLGFHPIWVVWIMECIRSVSYSFLVNGAAQGKVTPTRGIRQGDPLSPYLFILCTEVLSKLCDKSLQDGRMAGVKVARGCPPINHLLFADDTMFFTKTNVSSCEALKHILTVYEGASGQCINLGKSAITFSSKTPSDVKTRIKAFFNIQNEGGVGKYLGLPEHFGRKKRDIFANLIDRIRQRSIGWTTRYLSKAGKQVLLQAVLAALPTYTMSCFKLPLSICKQIQSVLTRFWWDVKPTVRKLCWVSWNRLTRPKGAGGLGFREIEQFNDALLAKLAWRILKEPHSLLAQTLLGKYCLNSSFLECTAPASASHGWRGILAGREVLRQGLGWVVGNGKDISVWSEPWLSLERPTAPIGPPTLANSNLCVASLLLPSSTEWNIQMIRDHLPQYEEVIKSIIPSDCNMKDELVWLKNKSGNYTTKSGYALAKINSEAEPSDHFEWKKRIWSLNTSPKLKHLLWKANVGALPVGAALQNRGIDVDDKCKRCGAVETEIHVLLHCPFATQVWNKLPCLHAPSSLQQPPMSVPDLLDSCSRVITLPPIGLGSTPISPWVLWTLWTNRNKLLFENKEYTVEESVLKILKDSKAWKEAQESKKCIPLPQNVDLSRHVSNPHVPQLPLVAGSSWSVYSDAAWDSRTGNCGMGWHFSDSMASPAGSNFSKRRSVPSALVAEALALKTAISEAVNRGIDSLRVFSDSKSLISLLVTKKNHTWIQGTLFDIHYLSSSFSNISFHFIPRVGNTLADTLAKSALLSLINSPSVDE